MKNKKRKPDLSVNGEFVNKEPKKPIKRLGKRTYSQIREVLGIEKKFYVKAQKDSLVKAFETKKQLTKYYGDNNATIEKYKTHDYELIDGDYYIINKNKSEKL